VVGCWHSFLSAASLNMHTDQLMPLPLTVSCFSKIQTGFASLVPAHPGSPRKGLLNAFVCVCYTTTSKRWWWTNLAFWTPLSIVFLWPYLLLCPLFQQYISGAELLARYSMMPRRLTWETPFQLTLWTLYLQHNSDRQISNQFLYAKSKIFGH